MHDTRVTEKGCASLMYIRPLLQHIWYVTTRSAYMACALEQLCALQMRMQSQLHHHLSAATMINSCSSYCRSVKLKVTMQRQLQVMQNQQVGALNAQAAFKV